MPTERLTAEQYRALLAEQESRGKNKYNAVGEHCDGHFFDSQAELRRYHDLKLAQRGGLITGLEVHPRFRLEVMDCTYEADFQYVNTGLWRGMEHGKTVVEDVKGKALPLWKAKWAAAQELKPEYEWRVIQ